MFMLVSWFGLTLPLLNAADWFRLIRLLKRLFVSSHLSEVIYVWCYCWRYCRSEERRVGKECRSRWEREDMKKKQDEEEGIMRVKEIRCDTQETGEEVGGT